jgi:PIN domain nuclease of toxin-antitoxin system
VKVILDTHTFLWYILGNSKLSVKAKEIIDAKTNLYFSIVSLWEIAIKVNIGKLDLNCSFEELLYRLEYIKVELLPITCIDTQIYVGLVLKNHRDPFDRMLVSQAISNDLAILGCDVAFDEYPIERIWE